MTDYKKLVEALRYCAESGDFNCNKDCPMYPNYPKCLTKMDMDAAAAIEKLQAEVESMDESCKKQLVAMASHVADLQAEVDALKHDIARYVQMNTELLNDRPELEEIGGKWVWKEPKRGEWIVDGMYTYNLRELNGEAYEPVYRCSCCNRQMESYLRLDEPKMPEDADFPEYCPHCGAKMTGEQDVE